MTGGDTNIIAPSTAQSYVCSLRVVDDDGNAGYDTKVVNVSTRPPSANAGNDTTVGINDTITLHGIGTDETDIVKYEWKIGNHQWATSNTGDTAIIAPSMPEIFACSLRVTDDDGNAAYDE